MNGYREKIFFTAQVLEHLYCSGTVNTGLTSKLSTEKQVCFLHKYGAFFQHLETCTYIYYCEKAFSTSLHDIQEKGHALTTKSQSSKFNLVD